MKIAILGGTGFVGSNIAAALASSGHQVSLWHWCCRTSAGDINDEAALDAALAECDAVIYSIGLLREFPDRGITFENTQYEGVVNSVAAAKRAGVERFILISANGIRIPGTAYQGTKLRAEQHLAASGLDATILRPSVIFGDPGENMEFATQLYRDMVASPMPAVGFFTGLSPESGAVLMSPVHVADVAAAVAAVLQNPTGPEPLVLGGPDVLSWPEMIRRIAAAVGKSKLIIPMPIAVMKLAATLLDRIPAFPVTRDQLTMLAENNIADPATLGQLIGRSPQAFVAENLTYLKGA